MTRTPEMTLPRHTIRLAGTLAAAGALALAAPALAQDAQPVDPLGDATIARSAAEADAGKRFDALDTDHDGSLSAAEMAAGRPQPGPGGAAAGNPRPRRDGGGQRMMGRMADANGDGKITREEFTATALRRFDRMDANHDGQLTSAERKTAMEAMRARMMERMAAGAMGGDGPAGD